MSANPETDDIIPFHGTAQWAQAERRVMALLLSYSDSVRDVRSDPRWQREDVDFVCLDKRGVPCFVEVKADSRVLDTGNIAFEIVSNFERGTLGCYVNCKADYLVHVATVGDPWIARVIDLPRLRRWFTESSDRAFRMIKSRTRGRDGRLYTSLAVLVPVSEIQDCIIKEAQV